MSWGEWKEAKAIRNEEQMEHYRKVLAKEFGATPEQLEKALKISYECKIMKNKKYQVSFFDENDDTKEFIHLSIKRIDREPIHDWRDLQRIKNELVGPEHEGIELYPAESRRVDTANQYHVYVLKKANVRLPFGMDSERIVINGCGVGEKQRPIDMEK